MEDKGGNLAGHLVVDFSQIAAGPTCTMMLADRGAEVIKIEPPGGDLGRTLGPPFIEGHGAIFMSLNRNKRSAALNLKKPEDLEVARRLVQRADIVVESFRPGVMERLGLDYMTVSSTNSRLVYCSISAYGQQGTLSGKPGVDGIVQATSGLVSTLGNGDGVPSKVQTPIVDMVTGFLSTTAILDALMARQRTGRGAHLDISMFAASVQLQQVSLASYVASGDLPRPSGSAAPYSAPNEAFPSSDGWLMIAAYQPKRWIKLCEILGIPAVATDARFATSDLRVANRSEMYALVASRTQLWTREALLAALEENDIICGPVNTYADVVETEIFESMTSTFHHPEAGNFRFVTSLAAGSADSFRTTPTWPAPLLGQHTCEVVELANAGATTQ